MKKLFKNSLVGDEPSLIDSGEAGLLKIETESVLGAEIPEDRWISIAAEYQRWEQLYKGVSRTNRRLQFLKIISEAFPDFDLRNDQKLVNLILADLRKPGEVISAKLPEGRIGSAQIIHRQITERFGVLYTLESQEGFQFTQEFFD